MTPVRLFTLAIHVIMLKNFECYNERAWQIVTKKKISWSFWLVFVKTLETLRSIET